MSHRGRPDGFERALSLRKDGVNLQKLQRRKIIFIPHFRFPEIKNVIANAPTNSMFLLENLRFLKGEGRNDRLLAKKLALLGDFYVNEAFAVSHRKNASLAAITEFLPSYAGLELEREILFLYHTIKNPEKPLVIILGGAKADDKLGVLKFFRNKADWFLLGGAPANTLLSLRGMDVGRSLVDPDQQDVQELRQVIGYKNIILPIDCISEKRAILDIGKKAEKSFLSKIRNARTVIWSGPLGAVERQKFSHGTLAIARGIARNKHTFSVAGGGETVTFLKQHHLDTKFSFISTGGGAMLAFLAGEKLPGIEALKKNRANRPIA